MRVLLWTILLSVALGTACTTEVYDDSSEFEFEAGDKDSNRLSFHVRIDYRISNRLEDKLMREYGDQYKEILFLPLITSVSIELLKNYSAIEIYNIRRVEIEEKIMSHMAEKFKKAGLELKRVFITSVQLPEALRIKIQKEFTQRFNNAMDSCRKEIGGVITMRKAGEPVAFYKFNVDDKDYSGIINTTEVKVEINPGDSILLEYACEEPAFNRLKKI